MAIQVIYSDLGDVDCASIPLLWKDIPDVNVMRLATDTDYSKEDIRKAIQEADDTLIMCGHGTPSGLLGYVSCEREERPYRSRFGYGRSYYGFGSDWYDDPYEEEDDDAFSDGEIELDDGYDPKTGRFLSMTELYARLKKNKKLPGAIGPMAKKKKPAAPKKPPKMVKCITMDTAVDDSMAADIHADRVIAVWCHASEFAENNHLYGFWSSMFISNSGEARMCGFPGVPNELIVDETVKFWKDANTLLKNNVPLSEWVPSIIEMGNMNYPTTKFNYGGLRYYPK